MGTTTRRVAIVVAALLALVGCARGEPSPTATSPTPSESAGGFPPGSTIGVSFPEGSLAGEALRSGLTTAGFVPDVRYAAGEDAVAQQQEQIMAMIDEGAKVILIRPTDGGRLSPQLDAAKAAGIAVIALDYGVGYTDAVDYFLSFDTFEIGMLQGESLLDGLAMRAPGESPWNIEIFSGAARDLQAIQFFDGAMSVLQPKIDDGTLVVVSGQTSLEQTANSENSEWNPENSRLRMDALLTDFYGDAPLDGVLAANDEAARAILTALRNADRPTPVVTGQDSDPESVALMMAGEQYSTIYKDFSLLAPQAVAMVKALQEGGTPEAIGANHVDAEGGGIPVYLVDAVLVTADNAAEVYRDNPDLAPLTRR